MKWLATLLAAQVVVSPMAASVMLFATSSMTVVKELRSHAKVSCTALFESYFKVFVAGGCSEGSVRLENGHNSTAGRVEICDNGAWKTVCDKGFGSDEGRVVCRSLGLHADCEFNEQLL